MYDNEREALAYHEAGHAVSSILLNYPFDYVTIEANKEYEGHLKPSVGHMLLLLMEINSRKRKISMLARIVVINLHAGNVAEEIFLGHRSESESQTDINVIGMIAHFRSKRPKIWAQQLRRLTYHILADPVSWDYVTKVAAALLEKQTLTGEEVHKVLNLDYSWGDYCQIVDNKVQGYRDILRLESQDAK